MNEYYCGNCKVSSFSAATHKNHKCPKCYRSTVINPPKEEVIHAQTLAERVGFENVKPDNSIRRIE